ncbi:Kifc2 [Symbiodinium pilosum]|uniref:Kifc2 protein n=1 Tax=Symbiodinium pilosum TaxID=2952 RepID=A0A812S7S0_SYMPI|nr:Kifc2 [Symbiodinium pilosum]
MLTCRSVFPRCLRSSSRVLSSTLQIPARRSKSAMVQGADVSAADGRGLQPSMPTGTTFERTSPFSTQDPDFDFARHMQLSARDLASIRVHTLTEMGYEVAPGETDFAYSEPFQLLSEEGLRLYREAILAKPVLENCYYSCPMVPLTIRNMAAHNKFIRQMSESDDMLLACSKLVGCDLMWHPFKVEHMMTNIQMKGREATKVFDWHNDSNNFVLLVNLSDIPEDGRGGGTLLKEVGTGIEREVRAPGPGWAYMMQGSRVVHAANASENWTRIVSVISFCRSETLAAESLEEDTVDLFLARNYTDHALLDKEYSRYRLERSMEKLCFLQDRYLDECSNDFSSRERRRELVRHLDHMAKNLQITSRSLELLEEWDQPLPRPLRADQVPVAEIASWADRSRDGPLLN